MSVFIDGSALSSLLYSHANSTGNQEGVLLGQVVSHIKDHISDSQINNSQVHTFICIASHIPWPSEDRVYSRGGVPIMEKLAALLGDDHKQEEVVGWYSFRRNATLRMSMKEHTLHKHLEARFCPNKAQQFVFFLCVDSTNTHISTHSMDHFVATVTSSGVKKLSLSVTNLGDTLHTQYKTLGNSGATQSATVRSILDQFRGQFVSSAKEMQEVKRVNDMSTALNNDLLRLCKQVEESEHSVGELEQEVMRLKEELARKEQKKRLNEGESSIDSGKLYPQLSAESGVSTEQMGYDPRVSQAEQRLVVGLEQEKGQGTPSVDDLLSMPSDVENLSDNNRSQPGIAPIVDCPVNPKMSTVDSQPSTDRLAPSSTLQSVVDTITDTDEEEAASVSASDQSKPYQHLVSKATTKETVVSNKVIKGKPVEINRSRLEKKPSTSSPDRNKTRDHFSFVDNLLTSEGGLMQCKTATLSKGATVTYSPRTTRSQARGNSDSASASNKDKPKARNVSSPHSGPQSKRGSSPKLDGKLQSATVSSSKIGPPSATHDKRKGRPGKNTSLVGNKGSHNHHPDSETSATRDSACYDLGNCSKIRTNNSKLVSQSDGDFGKSENGSQENGKEVDGQEEAEISGSLSPVF